MKEENREHAQLAYDIIKDASEKGSRLPGSEGERNFANYMGDKLKEIGIELKEDFFDNIKDVIKEIGIELKEDFFDNIKDVIEKASQSKELEAQRQKAKNEAWMNQGHAGQAVVDFMVQEVSKMEI